MHHHNQHQDQKSFSNSDWLEFSSTVIDHNLLEHLPNVWHGKEPCHQKLHHLILILNMNYDGAVNK
jgi:hypothetical protein